MNIITIPGFIYLLFYFVLAGQAIFYLLCFTKVFSMINASGFIHIRKLAAPLLDRPLRFWYYGCLLTGILYLSIGFSHMSAPWFLLTLISYVLLVVDVLLATRFNIPVNKTIDLLKPEETTEDNMDLLRKTWLKWIDVRGKVLITGFILLLAAATMSK